MRLTSPRSRVPFTSAPKGWLGRLGETGLLSEPDDSVEIYRAGSEKHERKDPAELGEGNLHLIGRTKQETVTLDDVGQGRALRASDLAGIQLSYQMLLSGVARLGMCDLRQNP